MKKRKIFKKLFILLPNIQMTTTNTSNSFNPNVEKVDTNKKGKKRLGLAGLALLTTLSAKTAIGQEMVTQEANENNKELPIEFHGSIRAGSNVTPLLGSVLSNTPAVRFTIDASNPKSGIGASVIRFDDFNKSMDNPASQLTMVDLYCQKQFGKFSVTGVGEYVNIDKMPGADSFTPIVLCTYDAGKGVTIDACYCHTFQKGTDVEDFRIGATKIFNETFSLAAQAFYKYDGNHKFSGRVQANVNLKNGLGAQLNFTAKDGKITPTAGIMYKF